jgi:hypothetical protein
MNRITKATLLVFLAAVCSHAEYTFDNDKDIQEKESKRDMEREKARNIERIRFGLKFGGGGGAAVIGDGGSIAGGEGGIILSAPLALLNVLNIPSIGEGNYWLAAELNYGFRDARRKIEGKERSYSYSDYEHYEENYLHIPLLLQYVNFFFPASDIKAHLLPSPKRYFLMHFKTIKELGVFLDIPLSTGVYWNDYYVGTGANQTKVEGYDGDYKERNFFDLGVLVGYALQLESITLGVRLSASYMDFGGSQLVVQFKGYAGYLF